MSIAKFRQMSNNLQNSDLPYWLAFSRLPHVGGVKIKRLLNFFNTLEQAWKAGISELEQAGLNKIDAEKINLSRRQISPKQELKDLLNKQIKVLTWKDEDYPEILAQTHNAPPVLYYRGDLSCLRNHAMGVVGTRKVSSYGKSAVEKFVQGLATEKITIISGLAIGTDTLAHMAALKYDTKTIAVLGSGVDNDSIYPAMNKKLAQKILDQDGLIISEQPPGTRPINYQFPLRNRIISGLSLGVLIIEAPESSGALITGKYALEQNREIFAVPGHINHQNSRGCNKLIQQGAKLVCSTEDILEELAIKQIPDLASIKKTASSNTDPLSQKIITALKA